MARRNQRRWYVAAVNGTFEPRELRLALDRLSLDAGSVLRMFVDRAGSHCGVETSTAPLAELGGLTLTLRPASGLVIVTGA